MSNQPRRLHWALGDDARAVVTAILIIPILYIWIRYVFELKFSIAMTGLTLGWSILAAVNIIWMWAVYAKKDHETLTEALYHRPNKWVRRSTGFKDSISWLNQASAMALVAAIGALLIPDRSFRIQLAAISCAVMSWLLAAVIQAVAYARLHLRGQVGTSTPVESHFTFEQSEQTTFHDYLMMSFAIQAGFNYPGITVTSRAARTMVTKHIIVAFAFNTVIIAVLISVLLANVGR